jgi:dTDP-glucose 4,6-dehydratase
MRLLVTGGAGFIGSALVLKALQEGHEVLTIDKLTYAAYPKSLELLNTHARHRFIKADIEDAAVVNDAFGGFEPDAVLHLAAESHVDRSIDAPDAFIRTNVNGTFVLLEAALQYWSRKCRSKAKRFIFVHVSTDEVFGSLGKQGLFDLDSPYAPNSPYSASKAAADHIARAWHRTYGLPVAVTNCSNNFGPRQHPEKFIPNVIRHAIANQPIPIYGDGGNVRDWLYVEDHVNGLLAVAGLAVPGQTFLFGGRCEVRNLDMAKCICRLLDQRVPAASGASYIENIAFVADRPGHDLRYAIDPSFAERMLNWRALFALEDGLRQTVEWYLSEPERLIPGQALGRLGSRPSNM